MGGHGERNQTQGMVHTFAHILDILSDCLGTIKVDA